MKTSILSIPMLALAFQTSSCLKRPKPQEAPGSQIASVSFGQFNAIEFDQLRIVINELNGDKKDKTLDDTIDASQASGYRVKLLAHHNYHFRLSLKKGETIVADSQACVGQKEVASQTPPALKPGYNPIKIYVCDPKKPTTSTPTKPPQKPQPSESEVDITIEVGDKQQTKGYQVNGKHILKEGQRIRLKGINWFGFDTETSDGKQRQLHGLWTGKKIETFIQEVKTVGFNAFRIPVSPEAIKERVHLETFLEKAQAAQMHVLVDIHNCRASQGHTASRPCDNTIGDLKSLAELVKPFSNVVGIDVFNEPYDLTWAEWQTFVKEAADTILSVQPNILIFAEGIGSKGANICNSIPKENKECMYAPFWGENLAPFANQPLDVPKNKLVLSPHAYGPSVHKDHIYFNTQEFPGNMPAIWDSHFGYLAEQTPIAIGEFGGRSDEDEKERLWQETFVSYLIDKDIEHFFYWSLNPNSDDTKGLYQDDWQSINQKKLKIIKPLLDR